LRGFAVERRVDVLEAVVELFVGNLVGRGDPCRRIAAEPFDLVIESLKPGLDLAALLLEPTQIEKQASLFGGRLRLL
jgi:hypothetical protein